MSLSKCLLNTLKQGVTHIYETITHFHNCFHLLIILTDAAILPHSAHQLETQDGQTHTVETMYCTHDQNLWQDLRSRIKTCLKTNHFDRELALVFWREKQEWRREGKLRERRKHKPQEGSPSFRSSLVGREDSKQGARSRAVSSNIKNGEMILTSLIDKLVKSNGIHP